MKLVHVIFALYIAALSVYPCYDECKNDACLAGQEDREPSHNDEADLCSPFCVSACCAVHVLYTPSFDNVLDFRNVVSENSGYRIGFVPSVIVPIWQPPKLG
ncbi:DUF6660 family protein [Chryseolinea lacunae]|uniref:DUF6660 family protein n=1 Tax=Chryseolinea lacunae TaxID=2801331 RepID=UPI0034E23676